MSSGHPFSTDRSGEHSDISVTLNTYTHVGFGDAQEEMRRVAEA